MVHVCSHRVFGVKFETFNISMDCCSVTHSSQTSSTTLAAARDDGMNRTRETMPRPKRFPANFKCSENLQLMGLDHPEVLLHASTQP